MERSSTAGIRTRGPRWKLVTRSAIVRGEIRWSLLAVAVCAAIALGMSAPPSSSLASKAIAIFHRDAPIGRAGAHTRNEPPLRLAQSTTDTPAGTTGAIYVPDCNDPDANDPSCVDPTQELKDKLAAAGYPYYIGHAEPTAEFFSTQGTSGYNMQWKFQLPATEPSPSQDGTNVANFELYPALWMGLELCDPNSKPYGACIATSDTNNPATAGAAFLELQFYPPGSTSGPTHFSPGSCSSSQWCANLHINTWEDNNATQTSGCLERNLLNLTLPTHEFIADSLPLVRRQMLGIGALIPTSPVGSQSLGSRSLRRWNSQLFRAQGAVLPSSACV